MAKSLRILFLIGFIGFSQGAVADITAKWMMKGKRVTVEYRDNDNFRLSMGGNSYHLMHKGQLYVVAGNEVIDMQSLSGMLPSISRMMGSQFNQDFSDLDVVDLKRKEKVAGYTGNVYQVSSQGRKTQVVATADKTLQKITYALFKAFEMLASDERNTVVDALRSHSLFQKGILRVDNHLKLLSVSHKAINKKRFELPGAVRKMPDLSEMLEQIKRAVK